MAETIEQSRLAIVNASATMLGVAPLNELPNADTNPHDLTKLGMAYLSRFGASRDKVNSMYTWANLINTIEFKLLTPEESWGYQKGVRYLDLPSDYHSLLPQQQHQIHYTVKTAGSYPDFTYKLLTDPASSYRQYKKFTPIGNGTLLYYMSVLKENELEEHIRSVLINCFAFDIVVDFKSIERQDVDKIFSLFQQSLNAGITMDRKKHRNSVIINA